MKKILFLIIASLLVTLSTTAQTLTITTKSGSKQYSASEITSSSPATFSSNGTWMTIGGYGFSVNDITKAVITTENVGYVKDTCPVCKGDTHCTTCHGSGKGCTTCNGTGKYCSSCNATGKDKDCNGSGKCPACRGTGQWCSLCGGTGVCDYCTNGNCNYCHGSGKITCSYCYGSGACQTCGGLGWYLHSNNTCSTCHGDKKCKKCHGDKKEDCSRCYGSGDCRQCYGSGKCSQCKGNPRCSKCNGSTNCLKCKGSGTCQTCNGKPQCSTCGGDGHCAKCKNHDGKCTKCTGNGYVWVDIILSDKSFNYSYRGESKFLSITINQSWKATCSANWVTLKDAEGKNSGKVTIVAEANPSDKSRSATVVISHGGKSEYVSITQDGSPSLKLSKNKVDFDAKPSYGKTITITCNRKWYASSDQDWLSVSPTYYDGDGDLTLKATSNPTMDIRYATVTVTSEGGTETIDVTQAAGEGTIDVSINRTNCVRDGDYLLLQIKATDRREWTVQRPSNASWLHLDTNYNTSQMISGKGDKNIMLYIDKSTDITARYCTLTITSGSYTKTITIIQDAAPMSLVDMIFKPFGFVNLDLQSASYNSAYNVLASLFDLTTYSDAIYVEVYKNILLTGISYRGLPLTSFSCSKGFSSGGPTFRYRFDVAKSVVSDITPYVRTIYNDFTNIGVKFSYYDYYNYYVYCAYYDNVNFDFYVYTYSDGYSIEIHVKYK